MKAIIWLGNPGKKYEDTRHNVGFLFVDWLLAELGEEAAWKEKFQWLFTEQWLWGEKVLFLKPQAYMNKSGSSVRKLFDFYKLDVSDLLVVSDDIDMDFWKVRYRQEGRAGGHNGLFDIFRHLDTSDVARVKVGIGRDERYDASDWVLSKFTDQELEKLYNEVFPDVQEVVQGKFFVSK